THAMVDKIASRNVPAWLHEGLALHFEGHDAARAGRRLSAARIFIPLRALQGGFTRLDALQATVAYEESAFAADALLSRLGPKSLGALLADLDAGQPLEQAIERFGLTFAAFEAELSKKLNVRPVPLSHD